MSKTTQDLIENFLLKANEYKLSEQDTKVCRDTLMIHLQSAEEFMYRRQKSIPYMNLLLLSEDIDRAVSLAQVRHYEEVWMRMHNFMEHHPKVLFCFVMTPHIYRSSMKG